MSYACPSDRVRPDNYRGYSGGASASRRRELVCGSGCVSDKIESALKSPRGDLGVFQPNHSPLCLIKQTQTDEEFLVIVRRACDDGSM